MKRIFVICLFAMLFYLYGNIPAYAYIDKKTHPKITEEAVKKSGLNNFLKEYLEIPDGTEHEFTNEELTQLFPGKITKSVMEWLRFGSEYEDVGDRALNHFYDPLRNTGLDDKTYWIILGWLKLPIPWKISWIGKACKDWATETDNCDLSGNIKDIFRGTGGINLYCNKCAKDKYLKSLISETEEERNRNSARLFESLGKVLHLIEDMGVPAHTRNDFKGHTDFTKITKGTFLEIIGIGLEPYEKWAPDSWAKFSGAGNLYEYWVEDRIEGNEGYVGSLCTSDKMLIPKFSRPEEYWDKEQYNNAGFDPDDSLPLNGKERVGLSEYTSANYLSKCAMFTEEYFPYPREECLETVPKEKKWVTAEDAQYDLVWYQYKMKDGEIFDKEPFVKVSYTYDAVNAKGNEVYPAVGKLCYILDDNVHEAYAERLLPKTVSYAAGFLNYFFRGKIDLVPDDETGSGLVIENLSSDDMDGTFELYYDNTEDKRVKLWEKNLAVAAGGKSGNTGDITLPEDAKEPGKYILVFRGKLGQEDDAGGRLGLLLRSS